MLPQFGYIVAQAGADAHVPPVPPSGLPPPPPPPQYSGPTSAMGSNPQQQQSPLQYRHELHTPPPLDTRRDSQQQRPPLPYYRQSSPPPPHHHRHHPYHHPPPPPPPASSVTMHHPHHPPPPSTTVTAPPPTTTTTATVNHSQPYSMHSSPFRPPPPKWRDDIPQQQQPVSGGGGTTTTRSTASTVWHTPPPQPPQPATVYDYDPYHSQWDQEAPDVYQSKTMRKLRECNELMITMNGEFMEHSTVIYRNKLQSLQEELRTIQEGTHEVFMDELADLEKEREITISDAQCMYDYKVASIKHRYQTDMNAAEQDYEIERQSLHETIMAAIDDRRKLVRDDRDHGLDVKDLFRDAYHRIHHSKRNLRKRHPDRNHASGSPSRHENSRRRQARPSHPVGINGTTSQKEEDELDQEYALMKAASK
ncbi:predicted protein [Lichtheimia corymbifera JMRC:FSU:9682]|uniref:Uncharacterized protein n=1 Tax=Lichtheimia corymbifera JMRC:FSU:9682 TaxID=1263082 RepID=A0A068S414_9FUNG|nr:predicted protein [Lichtheimia corymbifera JMRC:FSU:9682]